jgi:hypothetical protein
LLVPIAFAALLAGALACATPKEDATREVHSSAIGYRVAIPSDWTLVDREMLPLLTEASEGAGVETVDPAMLASVRASVESGDMEFLFLATGTPAFRDNVNVLRTPGALPPSQAAVPLTCAMTLRQLSDALRAPVALRRCELQQVGGKRAFFLDWNNPVQKTRSLQYLFPRTPSTLLIVTGAFSEETAETNGERLRAFVESMEIDAGSAP